ncbi:MAG: phosphate acyltransferase PlsX [Planctomycetaceae bacterium]|nr:phosphate acyltransferase PlsX [Planctomycetota bacterium]NUN53327.1 phosphate acyltransferase PlsX [Planctomycetaceae bacterium]
MSAPPPPPTSTTSSSGPPYRIAVDAMGGDHAPAAVVEGSLLALQRVPSASVSLVGDREAVGGLLKGLGGREDDRLSIVHASQVLSMGENPVAGLRAKPDNSISRTLLEVHEGRASAAFSAGNTGGVVAAATLHLDRLRGVKRPGIAVPLPTLKGTTLLIDVGANISCKPIHLVHYAHMAAAYGRAILGVENPRVAMLNIGEEEAKGTSLVKQTASMLKESGLAWAGNVEGHAVFQGVADVVVCDGFVGNIVLKTTEGLADAMFTLIAGAVKEVARTEPAAVNALKEVLGGLRRRTDYASYGGAPLLGFEGVVLIGHGRSSPEAVANAIKGATEVVHQGVNAKIREAIRAHRSASGGDEA